MRDDRPSVDGLPGDGVAGGDDPTTTVEERDPDADDVDAVGCEREGCQGYHERVAEELERSAARHGGTPTGNVGRDGR